MSILSGYGKYKRYILTSEGYKLCSQWTSSNTVEMGDGNTAETNLGSIRGITDSLTATSSNVALSASAGNNLQTQVDTLNSNFDEFFIAKSYLVNKTLNAYCTENVLIDNIAGYTPIGCFYDCNTEETVTCATAPKRRKSDNTFAVGIINGYPSQISTKGIIYVYYIKDIDIQ